MEKLSLSVIMPGLNEQNNIRTAIRNSLRALDDVGIEGEIIVINDGSTDDTQKIVEEEIAKDSRVKLVVHQYPHGFGASFWEGVDHATKDVVVVMPGDNENDPWEILRYFSLLEQVDIVIPFVFNKEVRSFFRQLLSFSYRTIINTTFKTNLNYTNGTVLYRRKVLLELEYRSDSFFFQTDMLIRLLNRGYLFAEVPYRLDQRGDGVSKAVSFPSFVKVVKGYGRLIRDQYMRPSQQGLASDTASQVRRKGETNQKFEA